MSDLQELPNIGKVAKSLLVQSGINSPEQLKSIGSKEAFLRIRMLDPTACIRMLYGIEGAIQGIRDLDLSEDTKLELKDFYRSL